MHSGWNTCVFTMGSSFHDLGGDRTSAIPSIQHEMTVVQGLKTCQWDWKATGQDGFLQSRISRVCAFPSLTLSRSVNRPWVTGKEAVVVDVDANPERTLVNVRQGRKLLAPLLKRNIHVSLPLILRRLGIDAQVIEEQRVVTEFLATGRKPIAVNRIDRFADVIR